MSIILQAVVTRLGRIIGNLESGPTSVEASQLYSILEALTARLRAKGTLKNPPPAEIQTSSSETQTSRPNSPSNLPLTKDAPCRKRGKAAAPRATVPKPGASGTPRGTSAEESGGSSKQATWTEVVGRNGRKAARDSGQNSPGDTEFPPLPLPTRPPPRKLPPLRSSALIVKVPEGSTYEDTVRKIRQSGVNPDDFGATVAGFRKTKAGDVAVDLGKGQKSRAAAEPLMKALTEKLDGVVASVTNSGNVVEMEVIDLEPTSTAQEVLTAVREALLAANNGDQAVAAATHSVTVTSMWGLKNGQQVAKVSVPRAARPTDVGRVRVGWTSCRFRIRRPDAVRCFKCHGFGHTQSACTGPDLSGACRKCGETSHKEKDCRVPPVARPDAPLSLGVPENR
ncbi:uncharacterized protein LOC112592836 [Melanaphis sacchari]|uniref:uncharacterized protein LOC112592836 n=1 Tax=Melanaphis sacchari TaxID=742174 RepID=UPI000DC13097|nr:uncharacterized protein LOC112592836 [Melanaphis sacchari]